MLSLSPYRIQNAYRPRLDGEQAAVRQAKRGIIRPAGILREQHSREVIVEDVRAAVSRVGLALGAAIARAKVTGGIVFRQVFRRQRIGNQPAQDEKLAAANVYVWDGNYYALAIMERLKLQEQGGMVRVGLAHYNTWEEVDRLIRSLHNL